MNPEHKEMITSGNKTLVLDQQMTWAMIIVVVLSLFAIIVGQMFKRADYKNPTKGILGFFDMAFTALLKYVNDNIGESYESITMIATWALYIFIANIIGFFGIESPSTDINFTGSLAIMVFIYYNFVGIKEHKWKYYKKFMGDNWIMSIFIFPIEIISHIARPVTLAMRMFGNVFAGSLILTLLFFGTKYIGALTLGPFLKGYFDIFDASIQTFIFITLTILYIKEAKARGH